MATDGPAPAVTDEDDHDDAIVSGAVHYDLALIKTVDTSTVVQGGQVTWTITVRNQGNVDSLQLVHADGQPCGGHRHVGEPGEPDPGFGGDVHAGDHGQQLVDEAVPQLGRDLGRRRGRV